MDKSAVGDRLSLLRWLFFLPHHHQASDRHSLICICSEARVSLSPSSAGQVILKSGSDGDIIPYLAQHMLIIDTQLISRLAWSTSD